ncbi:hypothetical protein [Synechococcus sp. CC9311]|uniref:hypothetical protein n=1 Tax=Synechococcus sp. (strain CC9311) TaxID=64471 RepID=UPI0002D75DE2|nr:hypothetical protein [Synechococcus sp. CC9311]
MASLAACHTEHCWHVSVKPSDLEVDPHLKEPGWFSITIASHPCGAVAVLTVSHHDDVVTNVAIAKDSI